MRIIVLALLMAGCSEQAKEPEQFTKYPNVPTYGIVLELQQEEKKWNQQK